LSVLLQGQDAAPGLTILVFVTVAILLLATAYLLSKRMELVVETGAAQGWESSSSLEWWRASPSARRNWSR
jgi:hypothetical protein